MKNNITEFYHLALNTPPLRWWDIRALTIP